MRKLIVLLAVGTALYVSAVSSASSPHPTLVMTPASPLLGDFLTFTGCGYDPNGSDLTVLDNQPGNNLDSADIPIGADGCFDTAGLLFTQAFIPGPYKVSATQGVRSAQINFVVKK